MSERQTPENDARCPHARVERREKFGGTPYWVCLDCGADSWDGPPRVIPPGSDHPEAGPR